MKYLFLILILYSCNSDRETASPIVVSDTVSKESLELRDSLTASIEELDSLKPVVQKTIAELKQYQQLKEEYENQEADIVIKKVVDSSALLALRAKLNSANNEIARLNGELASAKVRNIQPPRDVAASIEQPIITPDDNAIVIVLDGRSKKGIIQIPDNLTIYLVPYSKSLKKAIGYDLSCAELTGSLEAKYYNGLYFFNSVTPGKYFIKVCTYVGDYKLINKPSGRYNVTMQISPPIQ